MTARGALPPSGERAALAAGTLAARAVFVAAASAAVGVPWRDLALRYDGHCYLLIARTLPHLYVGAPPLFPALRDPAFLTGWLPLYPLLIRAAAALTGDLRVAALAVSWACSAAAVVLFHRLAGRFVARPGLAALVFALFPPTWLLVGSLGFAEPVLLCAALAAVLAALEDAPWTCACACAAALLAQKAGILVPVIVLLIRLDRGGWKAARRFWPCLFAFLPLAALQGYLWAAFGDPFADVAAVRAHLGGPLFGFPFAVFLRGVLRSSFPGDLVRRVCIASGGVLYCGLAAAAALRGRRAERPLLLWLALVLAFAFCLGSDFAFQSLPRYFLLGAPAAVLLAEPLLPRRRAALLAAAPLVLLPFFVGLIDVAQTEALLRVSGGEAVHAAESAVLR